MPAIAQKAAVLTRSYDVERTGANTAEVVLTPQKVAAQGLRRLFTAKVDDPRIEAQPLIVPDVQMPDGAKHDVLYVCSMDNTVWAFDAAAPKPGTKDAVPLWPQPVQR